MKDFQANTTRAEFCRAAVNFVEKYYDMPVSDILEERELEAKTFADTNDPAIAAAAALYCGYSTAWSWSSAHISGIRIITDLMITCGKSDYSS